jgi:hypothetical protein
MTDLSSVLRRFRMSRLGDELSPAPAPAINVEALQHELRLVIGRSDRLLWIWVGALVAMFVLDCVLVFVFLHSAAYLATLFTATGVGLTVVLSQLRQAWHEKFVTETFLTLLPVTPTSNLQNVIDQLLSTLLKA